MNRQQKSKRGYIFAHLLLRKLPASTRDNLNRANESTDWTLEVFRKSIQDEINHLAAANEKSNQYTNFKDDYNNFPKSINVDFEIDVDMQIFRQIFV